MKESEAIQALEHMTTLRVHPTYGWQEMSEVRDIAISALREIQQYREIGTVEECRKAVKRQEPKEYIMNSFRDYDDYKCPSCGRIKLTVYKRGPMNFGKVTKYCDECGQKLKANKGIEIWTL